MKEYYSIQTDIDKITKIGKNVVLEYSTIDNSDIGPMTIIKTSHIKDSEIGSLCHITDSEVIKSKLMKGARLLGNNKIINSTIGEYVTVPYGVHLLNINIKKSPTILYLATMTIHCVEDCYFVDNEYRSEAELFQIVDKTDFQMINHFIQMNKHYWYS